MLSDKKIISLARNTLKLEADAITGLSAFVGKDFVAVVKMIHGSSGRVIVSGIGKSAIIANKMVATFNSTGTPSIFLHAADAIHGDLGMIQRNDVVILISNSGNTPEIKVLAPFIKSGGNKLVAMVGKTDSFLAQHADYVLSTSVDKEACPHNLAPTSSTTAQLALGDALAVCLLEMKGFTALDFAKFHPGGALGKRLYLKVEDVFPGTPQPIVSPQAPLTEIIFEISSKRLGATAVVQKNKLLGIITDGDLRRMMQKNTRFEKLKAINIMTKSPKTVERNTMAVEALALMKTHNITQLVVTDGEKFLGFVHLHDLLKEGII
ncbi:MAG: KpsF/GutQ family sugar-phosphate isomerase [Bacteroidetes bacterium]|nr:KpsF/GutQ family sugar-phosphate isomerase [Bacteroidota bacterium]